jgi:hypothetical protein
VARSVQLPGRSLELVSNDQPRGMIAASLFKREQKPAYRPVDSKALNFIFRGALPPVGHVIPKALMEVIERDFDKQVDDTHARRFLSPATERKIDNRRGHRPEDAIAHRFCNASGV